VQFSGDEFQFGNGWRLDLGAGVKSDDVAVDTLEKGLADRFDVHVAGPERGDERGDSSQGGEHARSRSIELAIRPGSVAIGQAADKNRAALEEQAYDLEVTSDAIRITANASAGLLYGADTLVQLVKSAQGRLWLPVTHVVDWPDVELRNIFWDASEHLDRPQVFKQAIRRAAFFKANGFVLKLDEHFQYRSAPAVVEPNAMTPQELQDLTDYGLRHHVKVIPFIDAPGHVSWILKHPEYANLREYANNNYELCSLNPDTYKLLHGMFGDLLDANKGVDYFVLSTDEPYYVGHTTATSPECNEFQRRQELGSPGKVEAEFLHKAGSYLHDRGRTVQFWGEFPLRSTDISSLPNWLVNGETNGPGTNPVYAANGIRQTIYSSGQGVELMFPLYHALPPDQMVHPATRRSEVAGLYDSITNDSIRTDGGDPMGVFVAAWGDSGLHPETFWLTFASGASYAWHPGGPTPEDAQKRFYSLFYGRGSNDMARLYELMATQSQFFETSWDTFGGTSRTPIWGNSNGPFNPPRLANDQRVPLPGVPAAGSLQLDYDWGAANAQRLALAGTSMQANDELLQLLAKNRHSVQFQRYGLEVFGSIAGLARQNLQMLQRLGDIDTALKQARDASAAGDNAAAVAALDRALDAAQVIRRERNTSFHNAVKTWYGSWYPRVGAGNGRDVLAVMDDVKDHLPDRTVDMTYLILRELLLPLGDWYGQVQAVRNDYAQGHGLAARGDGLVWSDRATFGSRGALGSRPDAIDARRPKAFRLLSPSAGTVDSLSVFVERGTTARTLTAGIYADDHNHPGALVAQGEVSRPEAGTWNAVSLPATAVSSGQPYWIAIAGDHGRLVLRDQSHGGLGSQPAETSRSAAAGSLPATWSTGSVGPTDGPVLAYAPVRPGAGG
jgi:hypothetical protein